jgi:glucose/arabinose dehydrogenase
VRKPLLDLRGRIALWGARGLVAASVDRSKTPPRLYVAYAVAPAKAGSREPTTVRFSRFVVDGGRADLASETIVAGRVAGGSCGDRPIGADCIPSDVVHIGADIVFTDDGLMYLSTGDGSAGDVVEQAQRSQALDSLAGKILRVDRSGHGVPGNPYWNGDPDSNRSKIWARGFRNPFRLAVLPDGSLLAGDVGFNRFEELDLVERGGDYGWPCREGPNSTPEFLSSAYCERYRSTDAARAYAPWLALPHGQRWKSLTAGTALTDATRLPDVYRSMFVFADWMSSTLWAVPLPDRGHRSPGSVVRPHLVGAGLGGPVRLRIGPDGALYVLSINVGELRRIVAADE